MNTALVQPKKEETGQKKININHWYKTRACLWESVDEKRFVYSPFRKTRNHPSFSTSHTYSYPFFFFLLVVRSFITSNSRSSKWTLTYPVTQSLVRLLTCSLRLLIHTHPHPTHTNSPVLCMPARCGFCVSTTKQMRPQRLSSILIYASIQVVWMV